MKYNPAPENNLSSNPAPEKQVGKLLKNKPAQVQLAGRYG